MRFPYVSAHAITPNMEGFYRISHEAYHAGPGISSTRVKKALQSYAVYSHPMDEDTDAMAFGRAFHMAILEPHLYQEHYRTIDLASRRSKAWDEFSAAQKAAGREGLLVSDHDTIMDMMRCVRDHGEYEKLPTFAAEIMAITKCEETGLQIKCKADLFGSAIVDFKTTSTGVSAAAFMYDILKWNLHVSAAFYQDIVERLIGERLPFILVPVTKKAPFECEFYTLGDDLLAEGRKLYKAGLHRIKAWQSAPDRIPVLDKRMRKLYAPAKALFHTQAILEFIEGT